MNNITKNNDFFTVPKYTLKQMLFNFIADYYWDSFLEWYDKNWPNANKNRIEKIEWFKNNCEVEMFSKLPSPAYVFILSVEKIVVNNDSCQQIENKNISSFSMKIKV